MMKRLNTLTTLAPLLLVLSSACATVGLMKHDDCGPITWDHAPLKVKAIDIELESSVTIGLGYWWPYLRRARYGEAPDVVLVRWDREGYGLTWLGDTNCRAKTAIIFTTLDQDITNHELGHALGLGHDSDPENLMHPYWSFQADVLTHAQRRWLREHYKVLITRPSR